MPAPNIYPNTGHGLCHRTRRALWREQERNLLSGVISVVVIVVVCASVSQPQWFWLDGGGCNTSTLGLYLFFHTGHFQSSDGNRMIYSPVHVTYYVNGQELNLCVTPEIVGLMHINICLIFLMIIATLLQMLLDLTGPNIRVLSCTRKNGIPSIASVLFCVACIGVCYYITTLIEAQQEATKPSKEQASPRVQVKLDIGFYLLVFAGGLSVVAVGCNWLRPAHIFNDHDTAPLVEEWGGLEGLETFAVPPGTSLPPMPFMHDMEPPPPVEGHPPPPYTP
ncbi:transmembrane protein 127-like [Oratosquilla oratoria]|uniref:transmembrane protein 127-like n=1 Tax=Oratosquilla oratoria TaxID=337810 RepID=UPI003F76B571